MDELNTVVLLGAGRGSRLMPLTTSQPKGFTEIAGKRILDWNLRAFQQHGPFRFVFVAGYLKEVVQSDYPDFNYVENSNWRNTNILFSLICARDYLTNGFYSTYTDTLFKEDAVGLLKKSPNDITLVMDTDWRTRYRFRTHHPESDAEKMIVDGNRVISLPRTINSTDASGEFTGVLKMTPTGAKLLLDFYDDTKTSLGLDGNFVDNKPFRMAYLIHILDHMVQAGVKIHCVSIPGNYHEIDTLQDYELAKADWERFANG